MQTPKSAQYAILISMLILLLVLVIITVRSMLFGVEPARTIFIPQETNDPVIQARSSIPVGTERNIVLQELSDAWYRADCRYGDGSGHELFFYGSHELDKTRILVVDYKVVNGVVQVSSIGSLENYMLHLYSRCLPPEMVSETS